MDDKSVKTGSDMFSAVSKVLVALIVSAAAIVCVVLFMNGVQRIKGGNGIAATGSASCDFESDLIVWRGSFSVHGETPREAYGQIKADAELVRNYLKACEVADDEIVFGSVRISQSYVSRYDEDGNYKGEDPDGYDLIQQLTVTSNDIDKVEGVSRDITQLIESGVNLESADPEYYYTKLDEMKLDLIDKATANARERIDIIAGGSGSAVGELLTANLGVFQITATNSSDEAYSYGGTFNTSSRYKTASITVKLNYSAK